MPFLSHIFFSAHEATHLLNKIASNAPGKNAQCDRKVSNSIHQHHRCWLKACIEIARVITKCHVTNSAFSDIGSTSCEGASLLGKQKGAFRRRRSTSFCRLGSVWHGRWLLSGRTPMFPWIERLPWPLVPGNGMLNADAASLLVCLSSIQAEIGENLWYQTSFRLSPKHYMCQDDGFERHTVVLVGVTGDGKSSTGNTLQLVCLSHHFCLFCSHPGLTTMQNTVQNTRCGSSTFPVSAGFKSETQDSWFENVHRNWNTHSKAWVSW